MGRNFKRLYGQIDNYQGQNSGNGRNRYHGGNNKEYNNYGYGNQSKQVAVSEMNVRGLPMNTGTGANVYKQARNKIVNKLGNERNWIDEIEYFKDIRLVGYDSKYSRIDLIDGYLRCIKTKYSVLNKHSTTLLNSKIDICDAKYSKRFGKRYPEILTFLKEAKKKNGAVKELDDIKKEYDGEIRKIKDEHLPMINAAPGNSNFEYLQNSIKLLSSNKTVCMSIDVEAYEFDIDIVTEIGISIYDPRENLIPSMVPIYRNYHLIVEESLPLRNKKWVCDFKDCYLNGESLVLKLNQCVEFLQSLINYYMSVETMEDRSWERAFVGHNIKGDISWLRKIGVKIPSEEKLDYAVERIGEGQIYVLDTEKFYKANFGDKGCSLGKILRLFEIPHSFLHNAGNDSFYTLKLMIYMSNINLRKKLGIDNIANTQRRIRELLAREKQEDKIVPMSYSILINEVNQAHLAKRAKLDPQGGSKKKKELVHQTEFGGSVWFDNAQNAFRYNHLKEFH